MQNKPKPKGQAHDDDLLLASNVSAFKQWLIAQGIAVQEPVVAHKARGVHYWVDIPGCKPVSVQEGTARKARYAQTHYRLRPLLNSFLTSPMASAIKAIVRKKTPSPVMTVVDRKVQPIAAANSGASVEPDTIEPLSVRYLLQPQDIKQALIRPAARKARAPSVPCGHVFGVRVTAGVGRGLTVAAHMRVFTDPDVEGQNLVYVVGYPLHTESEDIVAMANLLHSEASKHSNVTILVNDEGRGTQFLELLRTISTPLLKCEGIRMGELAGEPGDPRRFYNRRAQCAVHTGEAIKKGTLRLARPEFGSDETALGLLGAKLPYFFDDLGRYHVPSPQQIKCAEVPSADLFEAISLAFHEMPLPTTAGKASTPKTCAKPLDQFLMDLRDDFAISCPLKVRSDESMASFANRRWEYAQAMLDARPL